MTDLKRQIELDRRAVAAWPQTLRDRYASYLRSILND